MAYFCDDCKLSSMAEVCAQCGQQLVPPLPKQNQKRINSKVLTIALGVFGVAVILTVTLFLRQRQIVHQVDPEAVRYLVGTWSSDDGLQNRHSLSFEEDLTYAASTTTWGFTVRLAGTYTVADSVLRMRPTIVEDVGAYSDASRRQEEARMMKGHAWEYTMLDDDSFEVLAIGSADSPTVSLTSDRGTVFARTKD